MRRAGIGHNKSARPSDSALHHCHHGEGEVSAVPAFSGRCKEGEFEIELVVSFASLSEEDRRSDSMKDKDEQTALIGMAIGAAVISLVATQKQINQGSIVDELVRLGRQKGDGVEDEVFVQAARLVRKGI